MKKNHERAVLVLAEESAMISSSNEQWRAVYNLTVIWIGPAGYLIWPLTHENLIWDQCNKQVWGFKSVQGALIETFPAQYQ